MLKRFFTLRSGRHRVYGPVQPFDSSLRRRAAREDYRRLPRSVLVVRGGQAASVPAVGEAERYRTATVARLQVVSR